MRSRNGKTIIFEIPDSGTSNTDGMIEASPQESTAV
ncbi:hypothetical protein F441_17965 [Phytophthora nicotianae CJ01A1]|uniref:Uncharacterized protein n=6 Tax=Phytophthora nicotianae TaxID=4792 RepID=W2PLY9_PHYN3|nr:hypothetical protein PPTG_23969 [Phytophthora nicotianae INRA-310]ETI35619.1 hypothetical protein F443_18084 [Phytophthora nicotianae P1569]ETL82497.1 hypothetical protein L917_17339 [Phytophthora nicotianae]ETO64335.1 hypothetical protein F444_18108 [Phytophthora nicotianae P1976]ETP05445.1 hypothetical protein F441_17965 [Phytophthora nicotianae CJ01A1]ETP33571.1 hypothetical protein F442_17929 [Phytophthora nicotianae P10297]